MKRWKCDYKRTMDSDECMTRKTNEVFWFSRFVFCVFSRGNLLQLFLRSESENIVAAIKIWKCFWASAVFQFLFIHVERQKIFREICITCRYGQAWGSHNCAISCSILHKFMILWIYKVDKRRRILCIMRNNLTLLFLARSKLL